MKLQTLLIAALTIFNINTGFTQQEAEKSVFSSTSIGVGSSRVFDTYLSPLEYKGMNYQIMHERSVNIPKWGNKWYFQQFVKLNFGSTENPAHNNTTIDGFISYDGGVMYKVLNAGNFNLFIGGSGEAKIGFIYNLRNGNNPATAKTMINLKADIMASYKLMINQYPLYLRLHAGTPFAGVFFSPHFGQSYYEIFGLDNKDGIIKFGSFNNQQAINTLFSVDIPIGKVAMRVGYYMEYYRTHTNHLTTKVFNNNFMIGLSKEFRLIPLKSGKKAALFY